MRAAKSTDGGGSVSSGPRGGASPARVPDTTLSPSAFSHRPRGTKFAFRHRATGTRLAARINTTRNTSGARANPAPPPHMSSTPTPTAAQPGGGGGPVSDGLSSLVLSKRYLSCARPPHLYRLEHDSGTATNNDPGGDVDDGGGGDNNNDDDEDDEDCGWSSVGWCAPSPAVAAAVQARYEPSDVFTPLVFEEIRPAPSSSSWMHHNMQPQQQRCATGTSGLPHRRPLQHLSTLPSAAPPPPERQQQRPSAVANKSSDSHRNHHNNNHHHHHQRHNDDGNGGNNKPGDLSWLVNFQVASIFESTASHGTAGRLFAGEWQEPETLKQQKKKKSEQKGKFSAFLRSRPTETRPNQ